MYILCIHAYKLPYFEVKINNNVWNVIKEPVKKKRNKYSYRISKNSLWFVFDFGHDSFKSLRNGGIVVMAVGS